MVTVVDAADYEDRMDEEELDNVPGPYRAYRDAQDVPVHLGLFVEDVSTLETAHWDRTAQRGAFVNLYGNQGANDVQIHDLAPGGETTRQHHLYDELVYVTDGQGLTALGPPDDEHLFEWEPGALFLIPPAVPYRHVNLSEASRARLLASTPLPQFMNLLRVPDLIFDPPAASARTVDGEAFEADGSLREGPPDSFPVVWEANHVPDLATFDKLERFTSRGAGGLSVGIDMPQSSMPAHISEFPVGRYKKAHRHQPGANVLVLSSTGYSLMWAEWMDVVLRVDWQPGSLVVPPARWFHQHFNTGTTPARYFALRAPRLGALRRSRMFSTSFPDNQIEYVEEDPAIRDLFEQELPDRGLTSRMPDAVYTDPEFEFST